MIRSYEYFGYGNDSWHFSEAKFDSINLLVGASGSGKTRFLNTLFNFAVTVVKGSPFRFGKWIIGATAEKYRYVWEYEGKGGEGLENIIHKESIVIHHEDGTSQTIVDRKPDRFVFNESVQPRLPSEIPSVWLFKEEPLIRPLYKMFSRIQRRKFFEDGLKDASAIQAVPGNVFDKTSKALDFDKIMSNELTVSTKMYLLEKHNPEIYKTATELFTGIFETIKQVKVKIIENKNAPLPPTSILPIFLVKESGIDRWLSIGDLSSGMQKVILIITDILTLPENSIYIIDEYENSLGVNAIDFLPSLLADYGNGNQFFITTHHPYLINNMPVKNWKLFMRKGVNVKIRDGKDLEDKFKKSKQKAFIQLINDPDYKEITE